MPWRLTSFLAPKRTHTPATRPSALMDWPPEETERLANGPERAQLTHGGEEGR
ncbi:hypothetical protein [Segniliparus rugosus]|uniref:Uncharacterized protein n=1 Tax=Segniliparus rugosus (strain ATCC BAA-974 / DSM 45345 / CCUG 50838 / CIP 108380 / JCM 13579 / CDC 945) TaxID=679197 RepID=U1LMT1_SEGRC|nr:hypothetical protein [Segniliparus rugosus]ERG69256.1 hypothetical protein HMPREF9336_04147 [Segniliparus rugosus ATCC BAA-974]